MGVSGCLEVFVIDTAKVDPCKEIAQIDIVQ